LERPLQNWSAERAANGVADGGVLINMLYDEHIYVVQYIYNVHMLNEIE